MSTAHAAGVPRLTWLPAALALGLLVLPVVALVVRADWGTLPSDVSSPAARQALALSLGTSLAATACCLVLGVPLALVLARTTGRAADVLRALVTLPLVLPPTVGGIALLHLLGRRGLVGRSLEAWFGVTIPFSTAAVVIAQVFVAMPFLVLGLEGALRTAGTRYEVVAATLGAGRWTTLRRVTLPLAASGLLAGTVLCFARALGEFGATALFAGEGAESVPALDDRPRDQSRGAGRRQRRRHQRRPRRLPEQGDISRISAEGGNIGLHPLQRRQHVE